MPQVPVLVVAALSARALAESAAAAGFEVVALDAFGDRDTRRAACHWQSIRADDGLQVDAGRLAQALAALQRRERVAGWLYGAGIEPHLAAACTAAPALPLLGNPPQVVAAIRDPWRFFAALRELGIAYPPVAESPPDDGAPWLQKDPAGSGGWQVRRWDARRPAAPGRSIYAQRLQAGEPISALFVAAGAKARVIGVQQQLVRPLAGRPYVFGGVVGPVPLAAKLHGQVAAVVDRLAERYAPVGLGSVDFLLDGERLLVLELNPRPTASASLYDGNDGATMRLHVDAVRHGRLGAAPPAARVNGIEIVYAERRCRLQAEALQRLASHTWCHDVPAEPLALEPGDPLCSVSATGDGVDGVRRLLEARRHEVICCLENG